MTTTYPLKEREDIEAVKKYLLNKKKKNEQRLDENNKRNYLLFMIGISSALRISDILSLKVSDLTTDGRRASKFIVVQEQKTKKTKRFAVSINLRRAIEDYLVEYKPDLDDYVFQTSMVKTKTMTRHRAYQILKDALEETGMSYVKFGTHGMRKTFAYHLWKQNTDITYIMRLLNHSSPKETLRYITVEQDELDEIYVNLNL